MDSRNGTLTTPVRVNFTAPAGLIAIVIKYQRDRGLSSIRQALIELLESHPAIQERYRQVSDMPEWAKMAQK